MPVTKCRGGKKRRFYIMNHWWSTRRLGLKLLNEYALLEGRPLLKPANMEVGFPNFRENPAFLFDKRLGRAVHDVEQYESYWIVSEKAKTVLEHTDPSAFAFVKSEVQLRDGQKGPSYWLCDVLRRLDVLDEERSRVKIEFWDDGRKYYSLLGGASLHFREDMIGRNHIFRLSHSPGNIICDDELKLAFKTAKLTGTRFQDAANFL